MANWPLEKSNERMDTEKNWLFCSNTFNFWISKKKIDRLEAVWICKTIYAGHFLLKLTQYEKNGWIDKNFIFAGKSDN